MPNAGQASLLIVAAISCISSAGQNLENKGVKQKHVYVSFYALTGGQWWFARGNQPLSVSFPYTVTDATGLTSSGTFHSKVIRPYSGAKAYTFPIGIELGTLRQFFPVSIYFTFIGDYAGLKGSFGYGRNFYLNFFSHRASDPDHRPIVLKTSLNIERVYYRGHDSGSPFYLGSIDNENKYIQVLGNTAAPTYTPPGRFAIVTTSKTLDIYYAQTEWALVPKIAICNNPFRHRLHLELSLGYYVPFQVAGTILLAQNSDHVVKKFNLSNPGITVMSNDLRLSSSPYQISGLIIGATVGFSFPLHSGS